MIARTSGAREVTVTGLRSDTARLRFAERIGARAVAVDPAERGDGVADRVGSGYDLVLDVSGSAVAISSAADHLRAQGTFVLAGLTGGGVSVALGTDDLVRREIRIQGVLSKDEAAIRAARALVETDSRLAEDVASLFTHVFPLAEAEAAITAFDAGLDGFVKAAVRPPERSPGVGGGG